MARIAHSGMTADEVTENIEAAVQTVVAKLNMVRELSCVYPVWQIHQRSGPNCLGEENQLQHSLNSLIKCVQC